MTYKPSTAKYKGKTKTYWIVYDHKQRTRWGTEAWVKRAKRVYIPGTLIRTEIGTFTNRKGRKVYGVLFEYENPRKAFKAQRGKTKYGVSRAVVTVKKIVELPYPTRAIKIMDRRPEPTAMNIT